ncbi:alkaline phosphatase family protein [Heliorestis convoluta]|uniref:2,3-bisphosphoglycerate-independent phosphoglycerate mutase, putative n=1 Tax=Heliorestis convoluta TaxID=356322 RepID=A0A5Q2MVI6_9FIRM|nr:alkaline phosphatase family protein [Heliorestis convoluta]QGG46214.1 2,3-bisphosphoglycerate-independent phosphoglycerate mutase, putative [Heliorestis convoluta]
MGGNHFRSVNKVLLLVIDGMDCVNLTMAHTPIMDGIHGKTAVGVAHTEVLGAGAAITPIAHAMMGTGYNVIAHRPGKVATGRPYDYHGAPVETVGEVAREAGLLTAAVGKNEAAIVLGGSDQVDLRRLEMDGVDGSDDQVLSREILHILDQMDSGILVANYAAVDMMGHRKNVSLLIESVEKADALVGKLLESVDLEKTLLIITADHGTNPYTGNHNTAPTPICLITGQIKGRQNLGVVHNLEIAPTITSALGLRRPKQAFGRNLLPLAFGEKTEYSYHIQLEEQLEELYRLDQPRHLQQHT